MLKRYLWIAHHRRYHLVEKAPPADLEVEQIFEVGEWEKLREDVSNWKSVGPGSGFVLQGIRYDGDNWGSLYDGFSGEQERWAGPTSHLERAERLMIGQKVRVKLSVKQRRLGWSTLMEVELVEDEELHIGDWVKVRASVSTPTHQWVEVNHSSVGVVHRMENGDPSVSWSWQEKHLEAICIS